MDKEDIVTITAQNKKKHKFDWKANLILYMLSLLGFICIPIIMGRQRADIWMIAEAAAVYTSLYIFLWCVVELMKISIYGFKCLGGNFHSEYIKFNTKSVELGTWQLIIKYEKFDRIVCHADTLALEKNGYGIVASCSLALFTDEQRSQILNEFKKHDKNSSISEVTILKRSFTPWNKFFVLFIICIILLGIGIKYSEVLSYVSGTMMFAAYIFCALYTITFNEHFVEIRCEKVKYSRFNEVYISPKNTLSLRMGSQQIIKETSLTPFDTKEIEQIIKEFENHNITITDNRTSSTKEETKFREKNTGNVLILFSAITCSYGLMMLLTDEGSFVFLLAGGFITSLASYWYHRGDISFSKDKICISGTEERWILLSSVSIAKIEADNNLVFYDNNNDVEYSYDMNDLRKSDRQSFINTLSKRVLLSIDPQIAKENNYTLPNDAIKEDNTSNRRRIVTTTAEIIPIKAVNKPTQTQRSLELGTSEASDDNKKVKRRLEL